MVALFTHGDNDNFQKVQAAHKVQRAVHATFQQ